MQAKLVTRNLAGRRRLQCARRYEGSLRLRSALSRTFATSGIVFIICTNRAIREFDLEQQS